MMSGKAPVDVKSIYSNLQNNRESEAMQLNLSKDSRVPAARTVLKLDHYKKTK